VRWKEKENNLGVFDTTTKTYKKALIIGISHYDKLQSLDLCKNDAEGLLGILSEQEYEIPSNSRLIGVVPYETMRKAINGLFNDSSNSREDTLIFYFSGHGLPDGHGKHYLAPSDIDSTDPFEKGLDFETLEYLINKYWIMNRS
jgi:caspase domain-containing protein